MPQKHARRPHRRQAEEAVERGLEEGPDLVDLHEAQVEQLDGRQRALQLAQPRLDLVPPYARHLRHQVLHLRPRWCAPQSRGSAAIRRPPERKQESRVARAPPPLPSPAPAPALVCASVDVQQPCRLIEVWSRTCRLRESAGSASGLLFCAGRAAICKQGHPVARAPPPPQTLAPASPLACALTWQACSNPQTRGSNCQLRRLKPTRMDGPVCPYVDESPLPYAFHLLRVCILHKLLPCRNAPTHHTS